MAMVLPLGKLTILIGAGPLIYWVFLVFVTNLVGARIRKMGNRDKRDLLGQCLPKEGSLLDVSNLVSGAFKVVIRQLKQEEPAKSASKPRNDTLVAQVNSLRHELKLLASNRPITIVTTAGSGRKYGLIIIVGVIGYGYVWWKGWKLPDFMFATRRSLSDACNNVGSQIDGFYSSLSGTKRELSSKIDGMDLKVDENSVIIKETGRQVDELRDGTASMKDDVRVVLDAVETLTSKVCRIEENQDITIDRVWAAAHAVWRGNGRIQEFNQALPSTSTMLALEAAPMTPVSKETLCLPPASPRESQPPSSTPSGAQKSHGLLQHTQSMSGLKDISESCSSRETFSNGVYSGKATVKSASGGSSAGLLGGFSLPRIVRTLSAVNTVPTN